LPYEIEHDENVTHWNAPIAIGGGTCEIPGDL